MDECWSYNYDKSRKFCYLAADEVTPGAGIKTRRCQSWPSGYRRCVDHSNNQAWYNEVIDSATLAPVNLALAIGPGPQLKPVVRLQRLLGLDVVKYVKLQLGQGSKDCMLLCRIMDECWSYNYDKTRKFCYLASNEATPGAGIRYRRRQSWASGYRRCEDHSDNQSWENVPIDSSTLAPIELQLAIGPRTEFTTATFGAVWDAAPGALGLNGAASPKYKLVCGPDNNDYHCDESPSWSSGLLSTTSFDFSDAAFTAMENIGMVKCFVEMYVNGIKTACSDSASIFMCPGDICPNNVCTDFMTDELNCGGCGNVCAEGATCILGGCVCGAEQNLGDNPSCLVNEQEWCFFGRCLPDTPLQFIMLCRNNGVEIDMDLHLSTPGGCVINYDTTPACGSTLFDETDATETFVEQVAYSDPITTGQYSIALNYFSGGLGAASECSVAVRDHGVTNWIYGTNSTGSDIYGEAAPPGVQIDLTSSAYTSKFDNFGAIGTNYGIILNNAYTYVKP